MVRPTRRIPGRDRIGLLIGVGRVAAGGALLAAPVSSVRLLGLDTATATRVSWLTQMLGARDLALGAGTVATARRRSVSGWLLAGAAADLADAAVITQALRHGRVKGLPAAAVVLVAGGSAALAGRAALDARRGR